KDLCYLSLLYLNGSHKVGNLYPEETDGVVYLVFVGKNSKTGMIGVGHLPRWVSCLIMLLLKIVNQFLVGSIVLEVKRLLTDRQSGTRAFSASLVPERQIYEAITQILSHHLGILLCVRRKYPIAQLNLSFCHQKEN